METGKTVRTHDTVFIFAKFCGIDNERCRYCSLNDISNKQASYYQACLRILILKCGPGQVILTKEKFKKLKREHKITLR